MQSIFLNIYVSFYKKCNSHNEKRDVPDNSDPIVNTEMRKGNVNEFKIGGRVRTETERDKEKHYRQHAMDFL